MAEGYSEREKLIAAASRAWRYLQWTLSDDFAEHEQERRVVIADGDYTGRPAVPIVEQQRRARKKYHERLAELRLYEEENRLEEIKEEAVRDFVEENHHGDKGRKRGGRALALQKYVRRVERQIEETEDAPDEDYEEKSGLGRPKMSRKQKIKHLESLVIKARKELAQEYAEMSQREKLWHQNHDLKSDRRQLRLALKSPENPQSRSIWKKHDVSEKIQEQLDSVCTQIARLEAKIAMLDAGITPTDDADENKPESLEEYRRTLEHLVKERKKIKALEEEAEKLGIDVSKLR